MKCSSCSVKGQKSKLNYKKTRTFRPAVLFIFFCSQEQERKKLIPLFLLFTATVTTYIFDLLEYNKNHWFYACQGGGGGQKGPSLYTLVHREPFSCFSGQKRGFLLSLCSVCQLDLRLSSGQTRRGKFITVLIIL